jgi:Flp pilus assembly pilin Flp
MMFMIARLQSFARDSEGQDLVEYAMLVGLIALVCVIAVTATGDELSELLTRIVAGVFPA